MHGTTLFVGNLGDLASEDRLRTLFSEFGRVKHVDAFGERDFGVVEMASEIEARRARKALHGTLRSGRVFVCVAPGSREAFGEE
ncbi:MAG: RNA-binding protein [bacterium]|nr:RNA-binding protein [bacterium]